MATLDNGLATRFPDLDADALKEIIDTEKPDTELHNYLNMAYFTSLPLMGKLAACGGAKQEEMIVKVLAAHFLTMEEQQPSSEQSGEYMVKYRGNFTGWGLQTSTYGNQALAMDCSGYLAEIAEGYKDARMSITTYYDITDETDTTPVI